MVPTTLRFKGQERQLPAVPCTEDGCKRCREGLGGYQFRWCDHRWTPSAALDLTIPPDRLEEEMYKPWPHGMLPIPAAASGPPTGQPSTAVISPSSAPQAWDLKAVPEPAFASAETRSSSSNQPGSNSHRRGQGKPAGKAARGTRSRAGGAPSQSARAPAAKSKAIG